MWDEWIVDCKLQGSKGKTWEGSSGKDCKLMFHSDAH